MLAVKQRRVAQLLNGGKQGGYGFLEMPEEVGKRQRVYVIVTARSNGSSKRVGGS